MIGQHGENLMSSGKSLVDRVLHHTRIKKFSSGERKSVIVDVLSKVLKNKRVFVGS